MSVSQDRWSCPRCSATTVIHGSPEDVFAAISAVQKRHGREHRRAADILAHLRMADIDKKRGAA